MSRRSDSSCSRSSALGVLLGRAHDKHVQARAEPFGRASRTTYDPLRVGSERHQREQPLGDRLRARPRRRLRRGEPFFAAHHHRTGREPLDLHPLGDVAQRGLAQRGEVLDLEEVVERRRHPLVRVHLAGAQPLDQRLGGEVDQHHLVRGGERFIGDRLPHARAR